MKGRNFYFALIFLKKILEGEWGVKFTFQINILRKKKRFNYFPITCDTLIFHKRVDSSVQAFDLPIFLFRKIPPNPLCA